MAELLVHHHHLLLLFFSVLGIPIITKLILNLLWFPYAYFIRPAKHLPSTYGRWAVVTGPTSGIGEAISMELAGSGLNLLLVGRSPSKLSAVSTATSARYPATQILKLSLDLSGDLAAEKVRDAVEWLDVGVLINNAGVAYTRAMYLHEDGGSWEDLVRVNVAAVTAVSNAVIPGMLERGRGAVVNIGSASAAVPPAFPLHSVYASTKAYIHQLSKSLRLEYRSKGIDIQCQVPMYVETKMVSGNMDIKSYHIFVASPETYARAATRWIGYESVCTPYWLHYIQWCLASLVPKPVVGYIVMHGHLNQRDFALKKKTDSCGEQKLKVKN